MTDNPIPSGNNHINYINHIKHINCIKCIEEAHENLSKSLTCLYMAKNMAPRPTPIIDHAISAAISLDYLIRQVPDELHKETDT